MKSIFAMFFMLITTVVIAQKKFKNYYKNGNILEEGTLIDGKRNGNYTSYYLNGDIKSIEEYRSGTIIQKKKYVEGGVLVFTAYMVNGSSKMQVYTYNASGQIKSKGLEGLNGLKDGEWFYYDENNVQIKIENYKSGERIKD